MSKYQVHRYHDICAGHRVVGHEGKCQHLHGHNYRIHFTCESDGLDSLGRVIDFGVVKDLLCMWVEENWDHKFLAYDKDPIMQAISQFPHGVLVSNERDRLVESVVFVPFNPTAENIAEHLVKVVGPQQLEGTGVVLTEVRIEETAKCHVTYKKED